MRYFGYLHIPDKAIIDNDSLRSVFTFALCFENVNVVDKFTEQWCGQPVHSHKVKLYYLLNGSLTNIVPAEIKSFVMYWSA